MSDSIILIKAKDAFNLPVGGLVVLGFETEATPEAVNAAAKLIIEGEKNLNCKTAFCTQAEIIVHAANHYCFGVGIDCYKSFSS